MARDHIDIQYHESKEGEYKIDKYSVDGFCEENNTVYEFLGDYWHGNADIFDPEDINPTKKITFGELYENTKKREAIIRSKGYNYVDIWENDFKILMKEIFNLDDVINISFLFKN